MDPNQLLIIQIFAALGTVLGAVLLFCQSYLPHREAHQQVDEHLGGLYGRLVWDRATTR